MRPPQRTSTLLISLLLLGLMASPSQAERKNRARREHQLPLMVSLVFHHSTQGIYDNAWPILASVDGKATLGLVVHELERTFISPDQISDPDLPGGLGNVQSISLGDMGADGLHTGRQYLAAPDLRMNDDDIRMLAQDGWELAFHGADHTPQTMVLDQVDGQGKLLRAYAAGIREIRRLLDDPDHVVRTNTLASNGWSAAVQAMARTVFDWTEVRWSGGHQHVPVVYSNVQEPHGGFNSIDFQRPTYDGLGDLDELLRLAQTDPAAWLIIQLHDVLEEPMQSPHPPTTIQTSEFAYLVDGLRQLGARFVTFSEGAQAISKDNPGNRLRNTHFGVNSFLDRANPSPLDWRSAVDDTPDAVLELGADGSIVMESLQGAAFMMLRQDVNPHLFQEDGWVIRGRADSSDQWAGLVTIGLIGPAGDRRPFLMPTDTEFCLEVATLEIIDSTGGPVTFEVRATGLEGTAVLSDFSLVPLSRRTRCKTNRLR